MTGFLIYEFLCFREFPWLIFWGNRRKANMLPAAAFTGQHMTCEIEFMQTLHNYDLYSGDRIIAGESRSLGYDGSEYSFKRQSAVIPPTETRTDKCSGIDLPLGASRIHNHG